MNDEDFATFGDGLSESSSINTICLHSGFFLKEIQKIYIKLHDFIGFQLYYHLGAIIYQIRASRIF